MLFWHNDFSKYDPQQLLDRMIFSGKDVVVPLLIGYLNVMDGR